MFGETNFMGFFLQLIQPSDAPLSSREMSCCTCGRSREMTSRQLDSQVLEEMEQVFYCIKRF